MIDLTLLAPATPGSSPADLLPTAFGLNANNTATVLSHSRRPAILTYASPEVELVHKLTNLPWYALGWRTESDCVRVTMFEGVQFAKGWKNIPDAAHVTVEADKKMQFYEVDVQVHARFQGLRYAHSLPEISQLAHIPLDGCSIPTD